MGEADQNVLRRKAGAAVPRADTVAIAAMTPARALRLAVARAGDEALGVAAALADLTEDEVAPDSLGGAFPDPALVMRIEGPDGATGLAVIGASVVAAVIEAQTLGRVTTAATPDRSLTRTDGILAAGFLDAILSGFGALSRACDIPPPVAGFAFSTVLGDSRAGLMALGDVSHLHLTAQLDFGTGAKTGTLHLVFPATSGAAGQKNGDRENWARALQASVLGSSTRLEAVLCRQKIALTEASAFRVGTILHLDRASLAAVPLYGPDGARVCMAALGRSGAMRAVRVRLDTAVPPGGSRQTGTPPVA